VDNERVLSALSDEEQRKLNGRGSAFFKLPEKSMELLIDYVNGVIVNAGKEILSGNIRANPYLSSKNATPCSYCEYSAVCCFELCTNKRSKQRSMQAEELERLHKELTSTDLENEQ
jgi:ATP-dependent helicase/DNAse subunit B